MLKTFRFSVLLAALVISAGSGSAAVFHYDFSIVPDPSLLQVHPSGYPDWYMYEQYFSGTTPLTVQAGDEITGTISFADGYSFRIDNTANVYMPGAPASTSSDAARRLSGDPTSCSD